MTSPAEGLLGKALLVVFVAREFSGLGEIEHEYATKITGHEGARVNYRGIAERLARMQLEEPSRFDAIIATSWTKATIEALLPEVSELTVCWLASDQEDPRYRPGDFRPLAELLSAEVARLLPDVRRTKVWPLSSIGTEDMRFLEQSERVLVQSMSATSFDSIVIGGNGSAPVRAALLQMAARLAPPWVTLFEVQPNRQRPTPERRHRQVSPLTTEQLGALLLRTLGLDRQALADHLAMDLLVDTPGEVAACYRVLKALRAGLQPTAADLAESGTIQAEQDLETQLIDRLSGFLK